MRITDIRAVLTGNVSVRSNGIQYQLPIAEAVRDGFDIPTWMVRSRFLYGVKKTRLEFLDTLASVLTEFNVPLPPRRKHDDLPGSYANRLLDALPVEANLQTTGMKKLYTLARTLQTESHPAKYQEAGHRLENVMTQK
ncbi:MAG: hypothetical protein OXR66_09345 [Candidatus Woesearchaeota archaeon]|nr:hypothetical protein [Candidatus Woesearchaeota archaeon]